MAYSPIEQGPLLDHPVLAAVAERHGVMPAPVALAWVLRREGVVAVPKAGTPDHVRENHSALDVTLAEEDLRAVDAAFPPPEGRQQLEML